LWGEACYCFRARGQGQGDKDKATEKASFSLYCNSERSEDATKEEAPENTSAVKDEEIDNLIALIREDTD